MFNIRIVFVGLTALSFWMTPHDSLASIQYAVSPLVIDVEAGARDIITKTVTLTNTGTQPITIYPTVNNISLKEGGTIESFIPAVESDRTQSLASWIEISRAGIDLAIGESRTVDVTFRIHPEPVPGTYHALLGFGFGANRTEAEQRVNRGQAPGTIVTLTVKKKNSEFIKLAGFVVDKFVTNSGNEAAVFRFQNPSSDKVVPKGEIIIYDGKGREVGSVPVNADGAAIEPGGEHTFTASIPTDKLFGKYKAYLAVEYGEAQRASLQDTSYFYALPLQMLGIVFAVIALVVIVAAWYVHKKYLDDTMDDGDRIAVHIKDSLSESKDHDIIIKSK